MHVLLWLCILIWLAVCLGWAKTEGIFLKTYFSSHYLIADTCRRSERGHRRIAKKIIRMMWPFKKNFCP